jgi:hypothetical protein
VLQVVAAVAGHDIEEQELPADSADLAASVGSGQGNHYIGRGHQLRDPVGETEWPDPA